MDGEIDTAIPALVPLAPGVKVGVIELAQTSIFAAFIVGEYRAPIGPVVLESWAVLPPVPVAVTEQWMLAAISPVVVVYVEAVAPAMLPPASFH